MPDLNMIRPTAATWRRTVSIVYLLTASTMSSHTYSREVAASFAVVAADTAMSSAVELLSPEISRFQTQSPVYVAKHTVEDVYRPPAHRLNEIFHVRVHFNDGTAKRELYRTQARQRKPVAEKEEL